MRRITPVLGLLVIVSVVGPALASPQPTPVCSFCGGHFETAAERQGLTVNVTQSTTVIQVHENGSATWTIRNRVGNGSVGLRENPEQLRRIVEWQLDNEHGMLEDATVIDTRMENATAVAVLHDRDGASRHAGLLVVDYLHNRGYEKWYHVNAESVTIRGPEGTVVVNTPESGQVTDHAVTWTGEISDYGYGGADLEGSPYVVYGPDDTTGTQLQAQVAIALATLPIVVRAVQSYLLWQTVLFAVVLGSVLILLRTRSTGVTRTRASHGLAAMGVLGVVIPILTHGVSWVTGPSLVVFGLGVVALHPQTRAWLHTPRRQAVVACALLAGTFAVVMGIHLVVNESWMSPWQAALRATAVGTPVASLFPLGGVLDRHPRRLVQWGSVAVAAYMVVPLALVNVTDPPSGLGGGFAAILLFAIAFVVPVVGSLIIILGQHVTHS